MKKFTLSAASLLLATLLSNSAFALDKDAVAAVNGKKITQEDYKQHLELLSAQNRQQGGQGQINRQAVLNDLINKEVLVQEAKKKKLDKDKKIIAQLKKLEENLMVQVLLSKSPAANPISDKEMQEVYDTKVKNADRTEYKASIIVVDNEAKAKELIKKLNDGADFAETAKTDSIHENGNQGGDLGWFSAADVPQPFLQAVSKLIKGTHSQAPVSMPVVMNGQKATQYHIIKLEDSRKRDLPKFEDIKDQIRAAIQNQRLQEYVVNLRNKAKIEVR